MVFNNSILLGAAGQTTGQAPFDTTLIGNSVWLDGSADDLDRSTTSHSSTEVVMACWFQLNKFSGNIGLLGLGTGAGGSTNSGLWLSDGTVYFYKDGNGATTNQLLRDIGWYHILASFKLDESTASNKGKLFINGTEVTSFAADPRSSWGTSFASTATQSVGSIFTNTFLKGYITQPVMLDGQSIQGGDVAITDFVDTFTFGTNGSQIIPKKNSDIAALASTAGGNSFCLDFANSSDLGNDISSNNNDLTPNSMSSANQTVHTPSLQFPVLNALNGDPSLVAALGYGNRLADGVSPWDSVFATKSMGRSGKYYYEIRMDLNTGSNGFIAGIHEESTTSKNWSNYIGNTTSTYGLGYALYTSAPNFYTNGSPTAITGYSGDIATGDIIMMAVDLDNNKLYWGRNGTFFNSGDPANGTGESTTIQADTEYVFGVSPGTEHFFVNFGQDSTFGGETTAGNNTDTNGVGDFKYTVPTGFQCLASSSLTAPDFQGIDYFNATLYTGNGTAIGSGGKAVTGTGFKPDWVWIKNRDAADSHALYDVVRGTTKQIESDTTAAQSTESEGLTTFGSDGFTVGNLDQVNTSSEDYVAWQWLGSNSTSTNTNGSLNTTVTAANADHFSIVSWTMSDPAGAKTLGHGLTAAPELIIVKNRTDAGTNWPIYAEVIGNTKYMYLSTTAAAATFNMWQDTSPTSTVFSVSSNNEASGSANDEMIAYCFRSVPGVCKVGKYIGNSSDNGVYLSLGFKPRWWLVKETTVSDASHDWFVADSARYTFNGTTTAGGSNGGTLEANDTTAEEAHSTNFTDNPAFDFLSDGIKLRTNSGTINSTGRTYVYMAMADIGGNGTLPPIYGR